MNSKREKRVPRLTSKLNIFSKVNLSISPRRAVSDTVYLQSHDRTHQSGSAFAYSSTYISERAMCARSYLRMWVRHTREASYNRSAGRKLCIRNRTRRFNGERKRRLKKRRDRADMVVGTRVKRPEIVPRSDISKSISGSCHEPWTTTTIIFSYVFLPLFSTVCFSPF